MPISKNALLTSTLTALAGLAIRSGSFRRAFFKKASKRLYDEVVVKNVTQRPRRVQEDKYLIMRNMLDSIERMFREGRISRQVIHGVLNILVGEVVLGDIDGRRKSYQKQKAAAPGFLTISPTKVCNLGCRDCYAASSTVETDKLDYQIFSRLIREQTTLWNAHFTVISGGEPFLYQDGAKDLLDIAREHGDNYFLVFTNGTLIDDRLAADLAEVGNITPAISVEGLQQETDARRGEGTHQKILLAFERLRKCGVPYGISVTATRKNAEQVVSDPFMDFYLEQHGALYMWIFQYMPIGRNATVDLMVTPEQRMLMYHREQHLIRDRGVFLVDFWNSGTVSNGCISAGRDGGFFYIDWKGDVMPCVFFPYTVDNIVQIYQQGGDLNTVLESGFFKSIRGWQREYGYLQPAPEVRNQIVPCPIRDHYGQVHKFIRRHRARPADRAADAAMGDEDYRQAMIRYGEKIGRLTDVIWDQRYLRPERSDLGSRRDQGDAAFKISSGRDFRAGRGCVPI